MSEHTRRQFLKTAAVSSAMAMSAKSYARVAGANERISIGVVGCGGRGRGALMTGAQQHAAAENIEITAVSDPHRLAREEASAMCKEWFGREARQFVSYREIMALDDVDAVMIASPDHVHTVQLKAAADAKKDTYIEKPLSMDMPSMNVAFDAVKASGIVVQVGTQLRSLAGFTGVREFYKTGALGTVSRVEQVRNSDRPYWYGYLKDIKEEDVDWQEFLHDRPYRPFDAAQYSAWFGYRDFSDGPLPNLGVHFLDLAHYMTGAEIPDNAVCLGSVHTWKDEYNFDVPDNTQAAWTYPDGFIVTYSTNFGNGSGNSFKIFGDEGVVDMANQSAPVFSKAGVRGATRGTEPEPIPVVERPDHMLNWLQCLRTRETPHAPIETGYNHSVAALMAMRAMDTGRRQVFDRSTREIREG